MPRLALTRLRTMCRARRAYRRILQLLSSSFLQTLVSTMLEIGPRYRTERELTNRIWSIDRVVQMVNSFFVRDLGAISNIVDMRPDACLTHDGYVTNTSLIDRALEISCSRVTVVRYERNMDA